MGEILYNSRSSVNQLQVDGLVSKTLVHDSEVRPAGDQFPQRVNNNKKTTFLCT